MLEKLQFLLNKLAGRQDLVLVVLLIAVIFMMILPLPTVVVDTLIAINMSLAVILLMVSIYLKTPLAFTAFPSVLLITTLFRLALSITTTRLILLQADAGAIVETFGKFVVAGNLIVGLVIFLIITIVQFIVITKGSERVAEVSARFSLDAMPGKQMSIDSDMRAGVIDMDQARVRRTMVEKESQLYGAMDGAMKFVKGDAVAGLIITAVNILGGITIGTLQRGMTTGEALQLYSILTIGDGLVSQIPALFISITAGIIVTRVSTDDSENLGTDIGGQLTGNPRSLMIAAAILVGFAFIPGFPTIIFLLLAAIIGFGGYYMSRDHTVADAASVDDIPGLPSAPAGGQSNALSKPSSGRSPPARPSADGSDFTLTIPLMVDVESGLQQTLNPRMLNDELIRVRQALYLDLGVPFPGIHLRFNDSLTGGMYLINVHEIPTTQGEIRPDCVMIRDSEDNIKLLGIPYDKGPGIAASSEALWVDSRYSNDLQRSGIAHLEPTQVLTHHLSYVLKKHASEFLGIQETKHLMTRMEADFGELVKEVQRIMPLQKLTEIFQRLVSEEISIRNLRHVLESLIEWGQKEKDSVLLAEYVRSSLKRYISHKYSSGQNVLPAYLYTPDVEDTVRNAIRQTSAGNYLALEPTIVRKLVATTKEKAGDIGRRRQRAVLLTAMDIRRYVRKLLEQELYELPVLSYQELTPEVTIQPLSRISI